MAAVRNLIEIKGKNMKIQCIAVLFIMLIYMGCAQAPRISEQERISPQKRTSAQSDPAAGGERNSPQKSASVPVGYLPETVHEFKAVPDGTVVSHDFVIKNTGDAVLTLSRISAG